MKMNENLQMMIPFIRYALIAFSTTLVNRGWFNAEDASTFANDPAVVELVIGVVMAISTVVWYLWSKSRSALKRTV